MARTVVIKPRSALLDPRKDSLVIMGLYFIDAVLLAGLSVAGAGSVRSALVFALAGLGVAAGSGGLAGRVGLGGQTRRVSWMPLVALAVTFWVGVTDPALSGLMLMTTLVIVPTSALRVSTRWLGLLWGLAAVSSVLSVAVNDEVRLPTGTFAQDSLTFVFVLWTLAKGASVNLAGTLLRSDLDESHRQLTSALERVEALADRDELTGLANRRRLLSALAAERDRADRTGIGFSVAMLDIDHFKRINDAFGHPAGDSVLRTMASLMEGALRRHDIVGRVGGEEFLLVLPGAAGAAEAQQAAERVRAAVEQHDWSHVAEALSVTVSIGVAVSERLESVEALIDRADRGLYRAKKAGRNRSQLEPIGA